MESFYYIQQLLETIRYDLNEVGSGMVWVGQSIAAIAAMLYVVKIGMEGLLGASLFNLATLRPFALMMLVAFYPGFMSLVDGIAMAVNNALGAAMIADTRTADILRTRQIHPDSQDEEQLIGIEDIYAEEGEEEANLVDRLTEEVLDGFSAIRWIGEKVYLAMMKFWQEIVFILSHFILLVINVLRVFFLVVLYICGPLVIAVSIIPGFEDILGRWLGRYLSVHLWLGIGNIFDGLAARLWQIIEENNGFRTIGLGLDTYADSVMLTNFAYIFLLIVIVGYAAVPIVASWVISGAGIGRAGAMLGYAISRGVGGATGHAATAAHNRMVGKNTTSSAPRYKPSNSSKQ